MYLCCFYLLFNRSGGTTHLCYFSPCPANRRTGQRSAIPLCFYSTALKHSHRLVQRSIPVASTALLMMGRPWIDRKHPIWTRRSTMMCVLKKIAKKMILMQTGKNGKMCFLFSGHIGPLSHPWGTVDRAKNAWYKVQLSFSHVLPVSATLQDIARFVGANKEHMDTMQRTMQCMDIIVKNHMIAHMISSGRSPRMFHFREENHNSGIIGDNLYHKFFKVGCLWHKEWWSLDWKILTCLFTLF